MKKFLCWLLAGVVLFLSGCILQGVKNPASPNPNEGPSDPPSSTPVPLAPAILEGMTLRDICYRGKHTFLLTDNGEVYFYGDVSRLWGAELYTTAVQGKKNLYRVDLPEKAEQLAPYCAVGESGKLYIFGLGGDFRSYLLQDTVSPNGELITVNLQEEIKEIYQGEKEIMVLTEAGKLYAIGGLTLFGDIENHGNYFQPVAVSLPEPVKDVVINTFTVTVVGESGQLYMAYRLNNIYDSGGVYPDFIRKKYPLPHTAQVFEPMAITDAKEIELQKRTNLNIGKTGSRSELIVLKTDGTVWRCDIDQTIIDAFFLPAPGEWTMPAFDFVQIDTQGVGVKEIETNPYTLSNYHLPTINFVWMKDDAEKNYLLGDMEPQKGKDGAYTFRIKEAFWRTTSLNGPEPVIVVRDGLLLRDGESLYFLGYDYDGLFTTDDSTPYLREIKNIRWIN